MGRLGQLQAQPKITKGRLGQLVANLPPEEALEQIIKPTIEPVAPKKLGVLRSLFSLPKARREAKEAIATAERVGGLAREKGIEVTPTPTLPSILPEKPIKALGEATFKVGKGFAETFIPAITEFFKTTSNIFAESILLAASPTLRKSYEAGNLDLFPTITNTTPADVAKDTIAAGIEVVIYRSFPNIAKLRLASRGGAGALQGLGFAVSSGLAEDKSAEEILKSLPLFGISGGAIGVVVPYILPILKANIKTLPKEIRNVFTGLAREIKPPKIIKPPTLSPEVATEAALKATREAVPVEQKLLGTKAELLALRAPQKGDPIVGEGFIARTGVDRQKLELAKSFNERRVAVEKFNENPTPANLKKVRTTKAKVNELMQKAKEVPPTEVPPKAIAPEVEKIIPETRTTKVPTEQLPTGTGEVRVSRLESRIKGVLDDVKPSAAEEAGITTYQQMNKVDQIRKAVAYVEKSADEAIAVLKGEKPAPAGLLHNSIAIAMEQKAATTGDANLAIKLASLRSTRAGQEISILTKADPANPITQINEIIKARAGRALKRLKSGETIKGKTTKVEKEVATELSKSRLKISEAEKILDSILC